MGELTANEGQAPKQRAIPCLRPGSYNFGIETVAESDPDVSFYDRAAAASVRLFNEAHEMVNTPFGLQELIEESVGSGAIVSPDGLVLTCDHVVANSKKLVAVTSSGEILEATPIFQFPKSDLALVQLKAVDKNKLPFLKVSSATEVREGQGVIAVGHPLGSEDAYLSPGNVSRVINSKIVFDDQPPSSQFKPQRILSMTSHIKQGNSGSPVLSSTGEIVGVVFAIANNEFHSFKDGVWFQEPEKQCPGASYAVPISTLKRALKHRPDLYKRMNW